MHLRINDVTVSPARIDELGDVLSNKAEPVLRTQTGFQGLLCAADRATGNCAIVSFWDSKASLNASEPAIASVRSETVDALDAELNSVDIAEVLREVRAAPSKAGNRARVVRIVSLAENADKLLAFYDNEAVPRLQSQEGFLNSRLIRDVDDQTRFAAVSHWADQSAVDASDANSAALRDAVANAIPGTTIERVTTSEIILIELTA